MTSHTKKWLKWPIFKAEKPELLQRLQSQQWFFMFYWRLFYKIHMLILIISIQLEEKRENREPLWTVLAAFSLSWPRFVDQRFKFGDRSALMFPDIMSRHSGRSHKSASFYWANVSRILAADRLTFEGDMGDFRKKKNILQTVFEGEKACKEITGKNNIHHWQKNITHGV